MSKKGTLSPEILQPILDAYNANGGNISATARMCGVSRKKVYTALRQTGGIKRSGHRPTLAAGTVSGVTLVVNPLPSKDQIKRYILTSAQNNTYVHDDVWKNILALAEYYNAELYVGSFSYDKNAYGPLAVKADTYDAGDQKELWFDPKIEKHRKDKRIELGNGLWWCGEMNVLPTANDPLEGLEVYSGRKSAIFPHAKMAMRSIATMKGEGTKFNYTTGTVTKKNYIQKKAGLKAEFHHVYGALLVEVNSNGNWWVRQLEADGNARIQDLAVLANNGQVTEGHRIEAITWGDIHATIIEPSVMKQSMDMLRILRPKYQFLHDIMEGASVNHHNEKDPFERHKAYIRGLDNITTEVTRTRAVLEEYVKNGGPDIQTLVVDSNHDNWFYRWLKSNDPRKGNPCNAILYHAGSLAALYAIEKEDKKFNMTEWLFRRFGVPKQIRFLATDESFTICNKKIECGMHGHLGPNGARGTPQNLSKVGRKSITAHTHSAGIYDGNYVAGTSTQLDMGYNHGPSNWSHSDVLTYPSGKRCIVTKYAGNWRA